jgi:membrane-bound serine protease (ClpP class)
MPSHIEVPGRNPICPSKGVLAVQTVKAALVAAVAVVALIVSLLQASASESGSLALTISIDRAIGPATANYVKDKTGSAPKLPSQRSLGSESVVNHVDMP